MIIPQIRACLVCEGARQEVLGKWTLLGFFGVTPDVRISITDFTKPVNLCFAFAGNQAEGKLHIAIRVLTPSGTALSGAEVEGEMLPGKPSSAFFMNFQGVIPEPGRCTVVLLVNGAEIYRSTFELAPPETARTN